MTDNAAHDDLVAETVKAVAGPIGSSGGAFYFRPDTLAKGKEIGLDGFRFYVLGRGGVLGDVPATVVHSAFGYFHPDLVDKIWNSARERVAPADAAAAYLGCAADLGRSALGGVEGLGAYNEAAQAVVDGAAGDGLTLFAGIAAQPGPDDETGKAMHLTSVLRELRGSVHLAALVGSGVDPVKIHCIRRPDMVETFGYTEAPECSDADLASLDEMDVLTDRLMNAHYRVLDTSGLDAISAGAQGIAAALS